MLDKKISLENQILELKYLRNIAGLNRTDFARTLGIPLRTVEDWEAGRRRMPDYLLRLIGYKIRFEAILQVKEISDITKEQKINIITDEKGNSIVIVNDIRFKGRQNIDWDDVERYIKDYVNEHYEIIETSDTVYIGSDFPSEFKGSADTKRLKGTNAKAKANATQELPMLLKFATNKRWQENFKDRHGTDAKFGWYRFTSRFALPVYSDNGELERYNLFRIEMLIRHASDNKFYLYDMVNVKKEKETGTPPRQ